MEVAQRSHFPQVDVYSPNSRPESPQNVAPVERQPPLRNVESRHYDNESARETLDGVKAGLTQLGIDFTSKKPAARHPELLRECCGGGCCRALNGTFPGTPVSPTSTPMELPANPSFMSLQIPLSLLNLNPSVGLTNLLPLPANKIAFTPSDNIETTSTDSCPPTFVTPHPPYSVFPAKVLNARELTKPGAEKRTYHFDIDVTDYPDEDGTEWKVGGAVGLCAPNDSAVVDEVFSVLSIPFEQRDEPVLLHTQGGRWPTIWGEDESRTLPTTRRELLIWTVDVQSFQPKKALFRVLAEYAADPAEKSVLLFLCSKQGQAAFCELRSSGPLTLLQLLHAFSSSRPPLEHLLSVLSQLMPRFYSLSNDPDRTGSKPKVLELAVSIYEKKEPWRENTIKGVGSGYFERVALRYMWGGECRVPIFRGLQANPLAKEFSHEGPMILIGAGVGIAPFRGFVQRRLQHANCANKVWVIQGCRDSLVDEIYQGEWGEEKKDDIRKVVQSRVGTKRYVQDEIITQSDLVWNVINASEGRVFVCGSTKGMGEGVEAALVQVAMKEGGMTEVEARDYWRQKEHVWQYIKETW